MHINGNAPLGSKGVIVTASKTNYNTFASIYSVIDHFRQTMQLAGIHCTGEIIPNGKLHRSHKEGDKHGTKNVAYILHLDGRPAGWFMDYKSGISQTWRSGNVSNITYDLTQQIKEAKRKREAETLQKQA